MKRLITRIVAIGSGLLFATASLQAASLGTSFTFQGQLKDGGSPANGAYDLQFKLFDALVAGTQVGSTQCQDNVSVAGGLFTVSLDFGAVFDGNKRFLEFGVRAGGAAGDCATGTYTPLTPRQELTATPYALYAAAPWTKSGTDLSYTAGNVGVGTTSPATRLHVVNAGDAEVSVQSSDANGRRWTVQSSGDGGLQGTLQIIDRTAFASRLTITTDGNVGIGTTTPASRLDVAGGIRTSGQTTVHSEGAHLEWNKSGGMGETWLLNQRGLGPGGIRFGEVDTADGVTERMRIDANGNVGIGTTPSAKLDVNGTAKMTGFQLGTSATAGQVLTAAANGVGTWQAAPAGGGSQWTTVGTTIYYNGGNVGVGTGTPASTLSVFGEVDITGMLLHVGTDGKVGIGTNDPASRLSVAGEVDITGSRLHVGTDDKVGIGTSTPATKLHVTSATDTELSVQSTDTNGRRWTLQSTGNTPGLAGSLQIIDRNAGASRMTFQSDGSVGIGTTSSFDKLAVNGTIKSVTGGFRFPDDSVQTTAVTSYWSKLGNDLYATNTGNVGIGVPQGLPLPEKLTVTGNIIASNNITANGNISTNGTVTASCGTLSCSDERYKTNIKPVEKALQVVEKLRAVRFDWKDKEFPDRHFPKDRQLGLIAQEVQKVAPEVVQKSSDGYLAVDYGRLTPLLVEAVQEMHHAAKKKDAELAELKARMERLEKLMEQRASAGLK